MSGPTQDQVDEAMAALKDYQEKLLSARHELAEATVSVRSKDRVLTVTMSVPGEVKSIKFHGTDYASMPPAGLAALLVETINQARQKAKAKAEEGFRPFAGFGSSMLESLTGGSALDDILAPLKQHGVLRDGFGTANARGEEESDG